MPRLSIPSLLALALALPLLAFAQGNGPRTEEDILTSVKLPDGYEATVFAKAPELGYPTACSAAIDGTLFVAVDENSSLDRVRNAPGKTRGYVMRLRDTDGDGKADELKRFAEMESPRGLFWDGPSGTAPGTLYVVYPPKLTAFTDTDGDGVADKQEDLITGLGFDLGFRGADHTTNGCRLAIDGFIYIAVGDYGFAKATAKDGTTLSMRGGGIVRIRPDGTGFEIVSRGQRNIYDVAISPTLDLFTRDNTNDGGGWDVRLSFVPPGAHMGYPTLFVNFPEDHLQPLADYGGGSPCGALWLDEPGLQNGLYTVEWGRNAIMYHPLTPQGAGWKAEQKEWLKIPRPTDMDVDAAGRIYITSWEGATYTYNGPNAGYVVRVVKKDAPKAVVTFNPQPLSDAALAQAVATPSAVVREAALREMLRRGPKPDFAAPLRKIAETPGDLGPRVAALQSLRQIYGAKALNALTQLCANDDLREAAITALGDSAGIDPLQVPNQTLVAALADKNARVRAAAIVALLRLQSSLFTIGVRTWPDGSEPKFNLQIKASETAILPLVADGDPIIAHLAVRALSELKAAPVCLAALDLASGRVGVPPAGSGVPPEQSSATTQAITAGALRALYGMYLPEVVDGLIARLDRTANLTSTGRDRAGKMPAPAGGTPTLPGTAAASNAAEPFNLRRGILNALCRLDNQDEPYLDPKEWWGTRPDTSGPVYKPVRWAASDKIEAALQREADAATGEDANWLIRRMVLTKVNLPGLIEKLLAACGNDTPARLSAIEGLFRPDSSLPPEALAALSATASGDKETPDLRARALRLLQRGSSHDSIFPAAVTAFASLAGHDIGQPALAAAFEDFTRDGKNSKWIGNYAKLAAGDDAAKRTLAQTVLINLATSALVKGRDKDDAEKAVEKSWEKPDAAASLLGVIARTKAKAYSDKVDARLKDPDNAVAEAALFAHQALGLGGGGVPQKMIGEMKYEVVFPLVQKGGDVAGGREIYLRAGCIACHTVAADEPPKGPILSAVAKMYDRAALTESILKPNARLAQGFESTWIQTKKGEQIEGFVTREGGDSVDVRNIAAQTVTIEKGDIAERGHREQSMMPEGLMNAFTATELANLLAYMESLKK